MPTLGLIRKAGFPIAYVDRIGVSALCEPQKGWAAPVALFPAQRTQLKGYRIIASCNMPNDVWCRIMICGAKINFILI